jgi:myo-inositol-1(or 4)-monophosphatase
MNEVLEFSEQLANRVGKILLEHYHSTETTTRLKADRSAVTQADLEADRVITAAIKQSFPDDLLLSEELQPSTPSSDDMIPKATWVIDPLDGTTNFSLGLHFWGVLIARLVDGWPDTAVLYFPLIDETYSARKGKGAFLNGRRIRVEQPSPERPLSFFACCSRTHQQYQVSVPYKTRILGSAAYTFCTVARGAAILGFEATPKIWDIAGAWLLVSEAGGVIETLDGSAPFPLQQELQYGRQDFPTLAAANQEVAIRAHRQILPK